MKGLSTEQNVHKSMNIVHDLATLIYVHICVGTLPRCDHPCPRSIKLSTTLSILTSCEKRYQALSR